MDAGMVITISLFIAITGSAKSGNLSNESNTRATTNAAIKYAINILMIKTGILYFIFP